MQRVLVLSSVCDVAASCAGQTATLQGDQDPLVYVPMGNSVTFFPNGDGAIDVYARMLEQDFGVAVEMRDHTVGGQTAEALLDRLINDKMLRKDLVEADVLTFLVPNDEWRDPIQTAIGLEGRAPADCGGDDNQQCLRDMISDYVGYVDAIFAEVTAIADPSEVLIRVQDFYAFPTNAYTDETAEIVYPYWREAQDYVEEVAGRYGIPVAQVYDEFMGPDGTDNPEEKGLIGSDHIYPTKEGAQRIAEMIHDLGYDLAS